MRRSAIPAEPEEWVPKPKKKWAPCPKPQCTTHLIDSWDLFVRLQQYTAKIDTPYAFIDTETDSLIESQARLFGLGIAYNTKRAFYLVWRDKNGQIIWTREQQEEIKGWCRRVLCGFKLIGHNLVFDALILYYTLGLDIVPSIYSDTILQKHIRDEERPFGLKEIAVNDLGPWADQSQKKLVESILANGGTDKGHIYKADTAIIGEYCCWDVLLTALLFERYEAYILADPQLNALFYTDETMPLYREVTIPMRQKGFPVNIAHFEQLKGELATEIERIEAEIFSMIDPDIRDFEQDVVNTRVPLKHTGKLPKVLADELGIQLPFAKNGKITLAAKPLQDMLKDATDTHVQDYLRWALGEQWLGPEYAEAMANARARFYFESYQDSQRVFNLRSNDHLAFLFYQRWGFPIIRKTAGGAPAVDEAVIDDFQERSLTDPQYAGKKRILELLVEFRKLNKLYSTYVVGILDRQLNGILYTSMLQFGTTSGRFSSRNPNCQNLPRIKEDDAGLTPLVLKYTNAIKRGFIAPPGYKIVNADYSSLEPMCFAHMSGDETLRNVFRNNEDLYSRIAIDVFKLEGISASPKDPNYLKKKYPERRQASKIFCLAVPYGAEAPRIKDAMELDTYDEAQQVIDAYLNSYPNLKRYMHECNEEAKTTGQVRTIFGRLRHLPECKDLFAKYGDDLKKFWWARERRLIKARRRYKVYLNNAKNFKIQGLAAHIVNRAMIALARSMRDNGIDGWIAMQVHDEVTCIVREDQVDLQIKLMKDAMENTTTISVPLKAEPLAADTWAEAK